MDPFEILSRVRLRDANDPRVKSGACELCGERTRRRGLLVDGGYCFIHRECESALGILQAQLMVLFAFYLVEHADEILDMGSSFSKSIRAAIGEEPED